MDPIEEFMFRLGAFCQRHFSMRDGFKIEFPKYNIERVFILRYAKDANATLWPVTANVYPVGPEFIEEQVTLEKISDAWCGYSSRSNTLVVMFEPRGN